MAAELLALREEVERLKQERRSPGVGGESGVEAIKREQTRVIIDEQLKAEQPPSYLASWENTGGAAESDPGGRVEGNSSGAEPVTGTADDYDPYSEYRPETRTDSGSSPLSTRLTPVRKKAEG
ncbi:hypothetical protein R3P38DRAFT_2898848 [Favolaschia claudopus]|uniref:Uncharacterized protein n=1 Tax=Favolaschia claudopus TaxID=2862362 RepID=A0AAW0CL08_9AGAR